jgi:hypothetical protein
MEADVNAWGNDVGDRVTDQVRRRQEFQRQHPEVHVEHRTAPGWHWWAGWTDSVGQHQEVTAGELKYLLNDLEQAFSRAD